MAGEADFRNAVERYRLAEVALDDGALDGLCGAPLVLVGEAHGVAQTPSVLYTLMRRLDLRGLALEWAEEEMRDLDLERLWRLPADAEFFSGDGRITAGHFALIARLREEGRLDRLLLLDRAGTVSPERERAMAERLGPETPTLAAVGAGHLVSGMPLRDAFPDAPVATLAYAGGRCFFHGERELLPVAVGGAIPLRLEEAAPAVVPSR